MLLRRRVVTTAMTTETASRDASPASPVTRADVIDATVQGLPATPEPQREAPAAQPSASRRAVVGTLGVAFAGGVLSATASARDAPEGLASGSTGGLGTRSEAIEDRVGQEDATAVTDWVHHRQL